MPAARVTAMTRTYADLHIKPDLTDHKSTEALIQKASGLGYRLVALTLPLDWTREQAEKIIKAYASYRVELASRCDLRPRSPGELLHHLRRVRRNFEIVAVVCQNKSVSRQAAKDRRVDLLNFLGNDYHARFFDRAEAELASSSLARFEIDMITYQRSEGSSRIKLLNTLRKETQIAQDYHVPIVLSSGATSASELRKPMETAIATMLFDFPKETALDAVSRIPCEIVTRNRAKLNGDFVAPGIRIVRRGKDH